MLIDRFQFFPFILIAFPPLSLGGIRQTESLCSQPMRYLRYIPNELIFAIIIIIAYSVNKMPRYSLISFLNYDFTGSSSLLQRRRKVLFSDATCSLGKNFSIQTEFCLLKEPISVMFYPCASNLSCGDFPEKTYAAGIKKMMQGEALLKKQSKVLIKQPEVFF